jgi:hypothetical protein
MPTRWIIRHEASTHRRRRRRHHLRQHWHDLPAEDGADRARGVLVRSRRSQQAGQAAMSRTVALIALVGEQLLCRLEDGRFRPLRFAGFGWRSGHSTLMPTSVDKRNHRYYVNGC